MGRTNFAAMECSIARALEVIGERWSLLILRDAFYGLRRFDDFREHLGIARNVLADRLARLVEHGVLERHRYQERPPRFEYRLTQKGRDFLPVLLSMMRWGDRWANDDGLEPLTLTHRPCGNVTEAVMACSACGEQLALQDLTVHPVRVTVPPHSVWTIRRRGPSGPGE